MRVLTWVGLAALVLLSGCGKKRPVLPSVAPLGSSQTGVASWYGVPYHGRRAANGEIYDMEKMTAAHRTLPFGTWVQVKNLSNNRTVNVRITDRGPFVRGRVLDLSHAAAESIAMIGPGTAKVKLTVIAPPRIEATAASAAQVSVESPIGYFAVQVGSFADRRNAERVQSSMQERYGSARIVMRDSQPAQWRVLVGREESEEAAEALAGRIRSDTVAGSAGAFVVRLDNDKAPASI